MLAADLKISASEALEKATVKPKPEYPALARQMRIVGKADIEVAIAPDGTVEDAKPVGGNPLLTGPTITTLKKWKFTPFKNNGEPSRATTVLTFNFQ